MEQDFTVIYEKLKPILTQLEEKRIALKAEGKRKGLKVGLILFIIGSVLLVWLGTGYIGIIISLVIGLGCLFAHINGQTPQLTAYYKQQIISPIISFLCEKSVYHPRGGITKEMFILSGLFNQEPDRYHSEDLIAGQIDKTKFCCSEILAEKKYVEYTKHGRKEHWEDIFRGFFFIADFQKEFQGQTIVYRNSWFKLWRDSQRVKLENPEFEKEFDTYSSNQVEARYLLTPNMMEKLLELNRKFSGKVTVSFYLSQMIIAIPDSTDHFEADIWTSMLDENYIKKEFSTLLSLFHIIDDLNLNLRIWTKE